MAKEKRDASEKSHGFHIHFTSTGLVVCALGVVLVTGFLAYALGRHAQLEPATAAEHDLMDAKAPEVIPPWGELIVCDTQMERPEEYTALEVSRIGKESWVFTGRNADQAHQLMQACGLTARQMELAVSPEAMTVTATGTTVAPNDELVFSLSPETRAKLYGELAKDGANHYMHFPFCFPGKAFDEITTGGHISAEVATLLRSLIYHRGDAAYLSDFEALMHRIVSQEERMRLVKALSAQSAVLVRLRVRPTTDVDKMLGYWAWAPGVRFTNLRPLLDSIKRLEDGATISLLYFLPQFARERLYTYPLPSQPNDPVMDCHWSTMNFFNDPPDNRFADPTYTVSYLTSHYYTVAKPTRYGDLVFILDDKGNAIHSAVYIADDIVFTKNGNNYMEPWMLMRMKNLLSLYSVVGSPRVVVYRNRNA